MTSDFNTFTQRTRQRVEAALVDALTANTFPWSLSQDFSIEPLLAAMRYAVLDGGKRLRAMLVYAGFEALTGKPANDCTDKLAAAMECIHAYSLIHDDLPAMDDDSLRRGKPTTHIQFNEATAILAGDALQTLAFELIADADLEAAQLKQAIKVLASASGMQGMVGGQQFDIESEGKSISLAALKNLHAHKTGALIRASVLLGGIAAKADSQQLTLLDEFASTAGLAFQVIDDILDIESDTETLGKQQGADIALNKATYPALMGMTESKQYASELHQSALAVLDQLPLANPSLHQLADFIINRHN